MNIFLIQRLITILGISLISSKLLATAQFPDLLIDGKDTVSIFSNPLEQYLSNKKERIFCGEKLAWTSTACYRGYLATWTIRENKLYLIKVLKGCGESRKKEFKLQKEFNSKDVFANWFTGTIVSPRGNLLQYVHAGYGSIYEKETYIYITNGIIDSVRTKNFLIYDEKLLNPSEELLYDTLRKILIDNLDKNQVKLFSDSDACRIEIKFSSDGLIDSIYNGFTYDGISLMEEYILSVADTSFKNLPRLMKVIHERYYPPIISIYLGTYCLKNPCDFDYGCDGYGCAQINNNRIKKKNKQFNFKIKSPFLIFGSIAIILGLGVFFLLRR